MTEDYKVCPKCTTRKPIEAFSLKYQGQQKKRYRRRTCKECDRILFRQRHTEWREKNRDHWRAYARKKQTEVRQDPAKRLVINEKQKLMARKRREQMKAAIYLAYGGAICACCGETEPKFLSIDHVNNDGHKHRKLGLHIGGEGFYKAILEAGCPPDFQILCMNCNHGKQRNGGVCPHQDGKVQRLERKLVGSSDPKHPALFCEEVMI